MKVTRLSRQRGNSRRFSVYLDGSYSFSLRGKAVEEAGLSVGKELSPEDVERLVGADELARAKEYAVLLLSYRGRTTKELRARLSRKGFSEEKTEAALGRLAELKLVDDEKFAQEYAESRIRASGRSRQLVKAELAKLGVARPTIEQAVAQAPDEAKAARELVEKYARRYTRLDERTRRQRLYALLARRGFTLDTIRQALKEGVKETDE